MEKVKNMTLDTVVQTIISGTFLALLGLVGKFLNAKIDCKLDKDVFDAKHEAVIKELINGQHRFELIETELKAQTTVLHGLDITTKLIVAKLEKNYREK